jgi:beta-N-acetylhexosaminidase
MPASGLIATLALIGGVFTSVAAHAGSGAARAARAAAPQRTAAVHPARSASGSGGGAALGGGALGRVSPGKLLGQRIMVGFSGTTAPGWVLSAAHAGRIGSVILFAPNIVDRSQLQALTGSLQHAARSGGNPPLLIALDQEGGLVKRLPNGPPDLSPPEIAATGSASVAFREGRSTGRYLRGLGVNWDLAPVMDVPTFSGAFIWQQGRAFSFSSAAVAKYATQFALGLQNGGAVACGKHFPGVGSAGVDTDFKLDELRPSKAQRDAALVPYETAIPRGLDSVMLSTAGFPAYDPSGSPTALSRPLVQGVLRRQLHFRGVTITDALATPTGHDEITAGRLAARAGADVLLYTDSASGELSALESDLAAGRLSRSEAEASYARIVALKRRVA